MNKDILIKKLKKELKQQNLKAFRAINNISLAKEMSDRAGYELADKLVNDRNRIYRIIEAVKKALFRYDEAFTEEMRRRALDLLTASVTVEELLLEAVIKEEVQNEAS